MVYIKEISKLNGLISFIQDREYILMKQIHNIVFQLYEKNPEETVKEDHKLYWIILNILFYKVNIPEGAQNGQ